jgi:hypothetical protein
MLLIEELVGRRLVRKRRIAQLVVENVVLPVARDRTLEIDEDASGPIQVDDPADRAMRSGLRRVGFAAAHCVAQSPRPAAMFCRGRLRRTPRSTRVPRQAVDAEYDVLPFDAGRKRR